MYHHYGPAATPLRRQVSAGRKCNSRHLLAPIPSPTLLIALCGVGPRRPPANSYDKDKPGFWIPACAGMTAVRRQCVRGGGYKLTARQSANSSLTIFNS